MRTLRAFNLILTEKDRHAALGLIAVFMVMACLEVIGVGALYWFIALVADPTQIDKSTTVRSLRDAAGLTENAQVLLAVGLMLFAAFLARNGWAVFSLYMQERFLRSRYVALCSRLVSVYLKKPYSFFLVNNSSELSKNVLIELWRLATAVIMPVVELTARLITAAMLLAFLLWQNFWITLAIIAGLGAVCVCLYLPLRGHLRRIGRMVMEADTRRFQSLSELFGSVKDVRVLGREQFFIDRFSEAAIAHGQCNLSLRILSNVPHFALEVVAVTTIIAIVLGIQLTTSEPSSAVAAAAMYAAVGYRLLPAIKAIMLTMTEMRAGQPVIEALRDDLAVSRARHDARIHAVTPLRFEREITLDRISFAYDGGAGSSLADVQLVIPKKSAVAFVGPTGAGKTTLIDLLLGLFQPTSGKILVDDDLLTAANTRGWQDQIGYVPQHIFLTDDSVRRNIAFGVPDSEIDDEAVVRAASMAGIHDFIESSLPRKYDTLVGERGVRMSGGERQRVGIARALYHRPSLLILDEATSALDGRTEAVISSAIAELSHEITLVVVAHRLSTVKNCDVIYLLDHGRIVESGTYGELMGRSEMFRAMART